MKQRGSFSVPPELTKNIHIVWFKRDLRLRDHEPLTHALKFAAAAGHSVLLLHIFELSNLRHPTTANRHLQFRWQAWTSMHKEVAELGWPVSVEAIQTDALDCFEWLSEECTIHGIYSYEETGLRHTYDRDKALQLWCDRKKIRWIETPQQAVQRGRRSRDGWATEWHATMLAQLTKLGLFLKMFPSLRRFQWSC
jgi:deoxyribodipyrimidine photo-lyase